MNEFEKIKPEIPKELIDNAVKSLQKEMRIRSIINVFFKILGITLIILVIIGIFTSIYRLEQFLEWDIESHYKVYITISFIIAFLIITSGNSIQKMHSVSNFKKPFFYYIFIVFALFGIYYSYKFL